MSENEPRASAVIDAYRRRRERTVPLLLGGLAVVLLVVGLFLVILWLTGGPTFSIAALFATDTPTPTLTHTPSITPTPSDTPTPEPSLTPTPQGPTTYVVEVGDTLSSIAERFGVEVLAIMAANNLPDPNAIFVGQELIIPAPGEGLPTETPIPTNLAPGTRIQYVVKPGDNLQIIASKFNSTAEAIAQLNNMTITDVLFVGRTLIVPVNIATPTITFTPNLTPATATPSPTVTPLP
ncbi:MAG TPA: LysM domain-containing protein [Anaerolineales bacterium]|nr:LysM domain-containing protein [Anaerolineales bacterium]